MKKIIGGISLALIISASLTLFSGCGDSAPLKDADIPVEIKAVTIGNETIEKTGLWEDATYLADTEIGTGNSTFKLQISVNGEAVNFVVHTNKGTVGIALLETQLIEGVEGAYGLFIKKVNGIAANYDTDKSYWAFYIDDEYATIGVDSAIIDESSSYKLEYTIDQL